MFSFDCSTSHLRKQTHPVAAQIKPTVTNSAAHISKYIKCNLTNLMYCFLTLELLYHFLVVFFLCSFFNLILFKMKIICYVIAGVQF